MRALPSGATAELCNVCAQNEFTVAEAERRVATRATVKV